MKILKKLSFFFLRICYPKVIKAEPIEKTNLTILSLVCRRDFKRFLHSYFNLTKYINEKVSCNIYNDGTLLEWQITFLKKYGVSVFDKRIIDTYFPKKQYTTFRKYFENKSSYPNKNKIALLATPTANKIILIDPDVITLKKPLEIIKWINGKDDQKALYSIYSQKIVNSFNKWNNPEFAYRKKLCSFANDYYLNSGIILLTKKISDNILFKVKSGLDELFKFNNIDFMWEERIFMLTLNKGNSNRLNPINYLCTNEHILLTQKTHKTCMLHCTHDSKYLFDIISTLKYLNIYDMFENIMAKIFTRNNFK